jgi:hypothetical protein
MVNLLKITQEAAPLTESVPYDDKLLHFTVVEYNESTDIFTITFPQPERGCDRELDLEDVDLPAFVLSVLLGGPIDDPITIVGSNYAIHLPDGVFNG